MANSENEEERRHDNGKENIRKSEGISSAAWQHQRHIGVMSTSSRGGQSIGMAAYKTTWRYQHK